MIFKSLKSRLIALVMGGFIPIILGLVFYVFPTVEHFFMEQKKAEIKSAVEVTMGSVQIIAAEEKAGLITHEEAMKRVQEIFLKTRYAGTEYFFAYDVNGFAVAHGLQPQRVGKDFSKSTDAAGKNYVSIFMKTAREGGAEFVDYKHERDKKVGPEDKLSYVMAFKDWNLIIGTGVYMSEVQQMISDLKFKIYTGLVLVIGLSVLVSIVFSVKLSRDLAKISDELGGEASGLEHVASRMSSISESLSSSTTQQASALQETSSSVEETSVMIERNAKNAHGSIEISKKSQVSVENGRVVLGKMMDSINDIAKNNEDIVREIDSSNKEIEKIVVVINEIGEKTKVINDIVFQTKLLSFNASVEAARAGEHGKGFAVVAEEVGKLAQMSGKSADDISSMLGQSIEQVESTIESSKARISQIIDTGAKKVKNGAQIADQCYSIFNEIVQDVSKVSEMIQEISTASSEQSNGVREINLAITELDSVAQQNSSMSQDTAATAEELQGKVISLKRMTDVLRKTVNG